MKDILMPITELIVFAGAVFGWIALILTLALMSFDPTVFLTNDAGLREKIMAVYEDHEIVSPEGRAGIKAIIEYGE